MKPNLTFDSDILNLDARDPYAKREAEKYANPIPSREYILAYLKEAGRLMTRQALEEVLGLYSPDQQEALRRRLQAMRRDGQLILTRRKGYGLAKKMDLIRGRVLGHKEGFGFVAPEDGSADLYLSGHQMCQVFPDDSVLVRVAGEDKRGRREAVIVEVLERNTRWVVGRYCYEEGIGQVSPANTRIPQIVLVSPGAEGGAVHGQMVTVEILQQPTAHRQAVGRVMEVLGEHLAPGMGVTIAIRSYNLPHLWPEGVEAELAQIAAQPLLDDKPRVDLRDLSFVTIDGADAKDFDDAVFCQPEGKEWRLWVAIADVSHYVQPGTALDKAAKQRGTSVYFPGSVLPMLPEVLSNDWCSLKPKVERLVLVCEMLISSRGRLQDWQFYPAVIRSRARLTYDQVSRYLATGGTPRQDSALLPHLQNLAYLYEIFNQERSKRGAVDFDFQEPQILFHKDGSVKDIVPLERTLAHRIIEACMLAANVSAARFLLKHKLPSLFRIHEAPSPIKLTELKNFLKGLGLRLSLWRTPKPADYARILTTSKTRPNHRLIQSALLRAMNQAIYSPENKGHFGLAFSEYTHFTSPIRRYPDLWVHRAIRQALNPNPASEQLQALIVLGEHCSMTERRADEATREVLSGLKCELIHTHLGEVFSGMISHVTGFGLFIALRDTLVEGLAHISSLRNDYYHFDATHLALRGERTGIVYRVGDSVRVRVARVDLDAREVDFEIQNP